MPVVPVSAPPYPTAEYILNLARTILLDNSISLAGDILSDQDSGIPLSAISESGTTVTGTTLQNHGLVIGQVINILNVPIAGYNGQWTVLTVPSLTTFTYKASVGALGASLGGSVSVAPSRAFTLLQASYESVQDELANGGYETPVGEVVLSNVTAMPSSVLNPAQRCYIGYDVYFDGLQNNTGPLLPLDMIIPTTMMERVTGTIVPFIPMYQAQNGLPLRPQYAFMRQWDWRNDRIYMVGATQGLDLWLRYQSFFPPLVFPTDAIKIFHGGNAVAYDLAYRFSASRGGDAAGGFMAERDKEVAKIITRTSHKTQHKNVRRQPYGGMGWGGGADNY